MSETETPAPETKALEGTTTVDATNTIEADILAHRELRKLAAILCERVVNEVPRDRRILFHHDTDLNALAAFRTFVSQMVSLRTAYDGLVKGPGPDVRAAGVVAGIAAITTTVRTIVDLLALFRTDRQIVGVAITIDDLALVAELGGALAAAGRDVYVTQLYPRSQDGAAIQRELDQTRRSALAAKERVGADDARLQQLDEIRKGYEDLLTKVVAEHSTAVATLVRGAGVAALVDGTPGANVVYVKVLKAGGTNETKRTLLGSSLKHSGGVVINFVVFGDDGKILAASTADAYSGEVSELEAS